MPEIAGISAGGMPGRVKCLHVHLGHALGAGPGVNPFGDESSPWWRGGGPPGRAWTCRRRSEMTDAIVVRRARTGDVRGIRRLVDTYTDDRRLLSKATVTLYEDVQEFRVAVAGDGTVVGCGALHVMWEDLAEIRTVAVDPACRGRKSATGSSPS